MSGILSHMPSLVIRQLLIDLSLAGDGWPVYATQLPDSPDDCVAVHDTLGIAQGRFQVSGEVQETKGIQIFIRSDNSNQAFRKAEGIKKGLTQDVHLTVVDVTDPEGYGTATQKYIIYGISHKSGPLRTNERNSDRKVFTLNMTVTLRETS